MQVGSTKPAIKRIVRFVTKRLVGNAVPRRYSLDDIRRDQAEFDEWRQLNPGKPLRDFSVEDMEASLAEGKMHSTLGGTLQRGSFDRAGVQFFERLREWGLTEDDTCVDYGCGTLRVGLHVMKLLRPGRYWGLDIAKCLLDEGQNLVGHELLAQKQPHLRVISGEALAEAAEAKPTFLFSTNVMSHVYPEELPEYFDNIMSIIGVSGQAIIDSYWTDADTIVYGKRCWAHSGPAINKLIASLDGKIAILRQRRQRLPLEGKHYSQRGTFRLAHISNANAF